MFEITDQVLNAEAVVEKVSHTGAGGIVTFIGVVRDASRQRKVLYLEYETYREMAEKKLADLSGEVLTRWPMTRIAISHRVGHLAIGEAAVVIAVSSPHRREAFEACEYAIDRLKEIVPIWKKEAFEDGEVWVGLESETPRGL